MMKKRQLLTAIGLAGLSLLSQGQAMAQADYPNKPIKLIVAFPPGGTSDVMGRLMADELGKILKQAVVVENIGGAGGIVGTERAIRLPADGYTLIQSGVGQNAVAHGLDAKLKYNSMTDLIHLTQVHSGPNVLVVHPSVKVNNLKEFIDLMKSKNGDMNYGSAGLGSPQHLQAEFFNQLVGLKSNHIPYKGQAQAMNDLIGGQLQYMFSPIQNALPQIQQGRLKALAVTGSRRSALLPDVPTVNEALGLTDYELIAYFAVFAPAGTPPESVNRLNAAINAAAGAKDLQDKFLAIGFAIDPGTPDALAKRNQAETAKWAKAIRDAKIEPQ